MKPARAIAATLVATLALAALPHPARAATPTDAAPNFHGGYIGIQAGHASGSSNHATDSGCPAQPINAVFCNAAPDPAAPNGAAVDNSGTDELTPGGITGGMLAGYAWQRGNYVFGGEADFNGLDFDQATASGGTFPVAFLGDRYALTQTMSANWLATIRARAGVTVMPKLLLYITGGVAFTDLHFASRYTDNATDATFPGGSGFGTKSSLRTGWTAGAGTEWLIAGPWSLKTEYLYTDFGRMSLDVPTTNTPGYAQTMRVGADLRIHAVRMGVNYRW